MSELDRLRRRLAQLEETLRGAGIPVPDGPAGEGAEAPELRLEERERLLSEAERVAQMGSYVWFVPRDQVRWSDQLFRILGLDPARTPASSEAFFRTVHPEDLGRVRAVTARGLETGVAETVAFRVIRPSGEEREVVMRGEATRGPDGVPIRFVGTVADVTDRVGAEAELRRRARALGEAQRLANVGSWSWEARGGRIEWSDQLRVILGVGPEVEPSEVLFEARVHPDDRAIVAAERLRIIREGTLHPIEFRVCRPDGEERIVQLDARADHDEEGRLQLVTGVLLDLTERKALERELLQARKMESLGRLAGGIAHDFNNLLTVIRGNVDLLRLRVPKRGPGGPGELDELAGAADDAAARVRQLLAFSRRAVLHAGRLDLNEVVLECERMMGRVLGDRVRLRVDVEEGLWPVHADASQVRQAVVNLILNARDALPGGGWIHVSTSNLSLRVRRPTAEPALAPGDYAVLAVRDAGEGMDEETRAQIFEPFFTTKGPMHGTGLGLAMVFGVVSQSGGSVEVDSKPGEGTEFRIYLPRTEAREEAEPAPRSAPLEGRGEAILLVEDEAGVRRLARRLLEEAGYRVIEAPGAEEARRCMEAHGEEVALLLTDIDMPVQTGPELATHLQRMRHDLPVLFMTGYARDVAAVELHPGARIVQKPFDREELLRAVGSALRPSGTPASSS